MSTNSSLGSSDRTDFLEMVCAVLIVLLLIALGLELFGKYPPDQALVVALATLVLVSIILLSFGSDLRSRLKKLGPLELYQGEARSLVEDLDRYRFKVKADQRTGQLWTGRRRFQYEELDRLVSQVEFEGRAPKRTHLLRVYFDVLFQVGTAAAVQGEWARAARRLERLVDLSGGEHEPGSAYFNLGLSYVEWAKEIRAGDFDEIDGEPSPEELWRKAVSALEQAWQHDPRDHKAPYWLAFALDELKQYGAAIKANDAALEIRPQFAPAKYNAAVSSVKLKRHRAAFERLKDISRDDELGEEACRQALKDEELDPLLNSLIGPEVRKFLEGRIQ